LLAGCYDGCMDIGTIFCHHIRWWNFKETVKISVRQRINANCFAACYWNAGKIVKERVWYFVADLTCEQAGRNIIGGKTKEYHGSVLKELSK
jgi:hypothetical protein